MRIYRNLFFTVLLISLSFFSIFAQSEARMEEDAEKLHDIYKNVNAIKDFRLPDVGSKRIGENYPEYQKALEGMGKTRLLREEYSGFLKSFAEKYAPNSDESWKISRELVNTFSPLQMDFNVGLEYEVIADRFSYLDTAGEKNALIALKLIRQNGTDSSTLRALNEMYRVKAIEEARNLLTLAVMFDPGNERIERRATRLRADVDEALQAYKEEEMKVLQSRRWKGNVGGTSAGSPASLAAAGKRFMTNLPDWGGNTKKATKIKKVSIIGDWFVAERDALGRPTRYGLPAAVAVSDNTMGDGIVTVYEVSMITREPKRNTNFYGVWVGNVWRMLDKNLPK
jgi:hypothetical protein